MTSLGPQIIAIFFLNVMTFPKAMTGLKLMTVEVPRVVTKEDVATLRCDHDLKEDDLYSVLWYKDHEEFYRYVPRNKPKQHSYLNEGFRVVTQKSNDRLVFLQNITLQASGVYRCEVSAEAPSFASVHGEGRMDVIVPPTEDPIITGEVKLLRFGDFLGLNCTSGRSYPSAKLSWFVNGQKTNPNNEDVVQHQDLLSTVSGLNLKVLPQHFENGLLTIRCVSSIYQSPNFLSDENAELPIDSREAVFQVKGTGTNPNRSMWIFVPIFMVLLT